MSKNEEVGTKAIEITLTDKQEKQLYNKEKIYQKGKRCLRLRWLKNLLFVLLGMFLSVIITLGAVFGVATSVSFKTIFGDDANQYVSDDLTDMSIAFLAYSIAMGNSTYKVSDFKFIKTLTDGLFSPDVLGNFATFDSETFNNVTLNSEGFATIGQTLMDCVKVTATLGSITSTLGISLGGLENLSVFTTAEEVDKATVQDASDKSLYFVKISDTEAIKYEPAYKNEQLTDAEVYYLPSLNDIAVTDLLSALMPGFMRVKASELFSVFGMDSENPIVSIIGDKKISELGSFDFNSITLTSVLPQDSSNEQLYNILAQAIGKDATEIVISDLATGFSTDNIKMSAVLPISDNTQLYEILSQATGEQAENITLGSLSSVNLGNIQLGTVLTTDSGNALIDGLRTDPTVTLTNLGDKINDISVAELFELEVFTKDVGVSRTCAVYTKSGNTYTYNSAGTVTGDNDNYYISAGASVWMFILFDSNGDSGNGLATTYTDNELTFGGLKSKVDSIGSILTGVTMRQLIDAGVLGQENVGKTTIYGMTLSDLIDAVTLIP